MAKKRESRASRKERQRKRLSAHAMPNVSSVSYALPAVEEPTHNGEPVNVPSLATRAPVERRAVGWYLMLIAAGAVAGTLYYVL